MMIYRVFALVLCLLLMSVSAQARVDEAPPLGLRAADAYDVAIVWHDLAHRALDAGAIIQADPVFAQLPEEQRLSLYPGLVRDVQQRQNLYARSRTPLNLWLPVKAEPAGKLPALKLNFPDNALPVFPYTILGKKVVLYPQGVEKLSLLPFEQPDAYARAMRVIPSERLSLVFDLVPVKIADAKTGRDKTLVPVICDIARARLVAGRDTVIWSYDDPRYDHLYGGDLQGLFSGIKE